MKKIFALTISAFLLWGCSNNPDQAVTQEAADAHVHQEGDSHEPEGVQLNDGKKWIANEEMKPFVAQGAALVERYLTANQTDYQRLAADLKDRNHKLIAACTMTGKSHDELHKWLEHHMNLVIALDLASDERQARAVARALKKSYEDYHLYFQ